MRRNWLVGVFVVTGLTCGFGCSSGDSGGSGSTSGDRSAESVAAASDRTVIDVTWGDGASGYGDRFGGDRGRDRTVKKANYRYDRAYYAKYVETHDARGAALPLVEQIKFQDLPANATPGSFGLEGATDPKTGEAIEPESEDTSCRVPFVKPDGSTTTLAEFRGKPLVVVFTRGFPGYICPMCTTYTAQFTLAYSKIKEAGAEMVLIFPGAESESADFVAACNEICAQEKTDKLPFPICLDADLKLVKKFNLVADLSRPATLIFDSAGKMRYGFVGQSPHERPNVERVLKEVRGLTGAGAGQ